MITRFEYTNLKSGHKRWSNFDTNIAAHSNTELHNRTNIIKKFSFHTHGYRKISCLHRMEIKTVYFMYLCRNFLWKSFLMVSLMKRLAVFVSPRAWFLNTTSSSHLRFTLKLVGPVTLILSKGFPLISSASLTFNSSSCCCRSCKGRNSDVIEFSTHHNTMHYIH